MEKKQVIKYTLLTAGLIFVLLLGIAIQRFLAFANLSTKYQEHFNGTCEKIYGVVGGEDITIDKEGIAWISAHDRRPVLAGKPSRGKIFTLDMKAHNPKPIDRTPATPSVFHPHGLSYFTQLDGTRYLFVVNHPNFVSDHNIVRFNISKNNRLSGSKVYQAPAINAPNDIAAVGPDQFYWTNDLGTTRGTFSNFLEITLALPWGSLGFFDGTKATIIYEGLAFGNGVQISKDGKQLYVAETGGKQVNIFDRTPATHQLTLNRTIAIPSGVDNLELDAKGNLWTAAHPKPLLFGEHTQSNDNKAPSQVFQILLNQNRAKEIYYNHGSEIAGAATAAVYKDKILLGPVFDDHLLLCQRR